MLAHAGQQYVSRRDRIVNSREQGTLHYFTNHTGTGTVPVQVLLTCILHPTINSTSIKIKAAIQHGTHGRRSTKGCCIARLVCRSRRRNAVPRLGLGLVTIAIVGCQDEGEGKSKTGRTDMSHDAVLH